MFPQSSRSFHSLLIAPVFFSLFFFARTTVPDNQPPVANPDHYTVHGSFGTPLDSPPYGVLKNDSDPDGDPLSCVFSRVDTSLGTALIFANGNADFTAAYGQTGTVTVPYTVCDNHGACSSSTVTFDVVNQAPVAGADEYTVHGVFATPNEVPLTGVLKNDTDPEGDSLSCVEKRVDTAIGSAIIFSNGKAQFVENGNGQTGDVSTTYTVCDNLGACSEGSVTFHVVNQAPIAGDDSYVVRGSVFGTPRETPWGVLKNDSDPEGDPIQITFARADFPQGTALVFATGQADFVRNNNYLTFSGSLSIQYTLCDNLGACSQGTVTFWLIGDGQDDGATSCNANIGGPINVTNGNMYLQQSDYSLPAVGAAINVTRTFNSNSQRTGLFGRGWSTTYDESITVYDNNLMHFSQPDGRAIYFGRPMGSSGAFAPLQEDFHGSLVPNGGGFTLTMKDGSVHQFNSAGKLTSISDRVGNQTTLSYDGGGKLTSVADPLGRVLTVTPNTNGQVLSISDTLGTIATYAYGGSSELLSVTYADNSAFNFSYDGNLRLTSATDALGNIVESHAYDSQGRALTSEKQGGVDHYSLSYVSDTETDVTDGLSRVTKYTFDSTKGRNVVTRVEGFCGCGGGNNSQLQTWTYDNQLNVTSKTDALNHVTSYTYDANGNRLTETDPTGTVTYTYNGFAEVLTRTDQSNNVTTNVFDGQGNLLTSKDVLDNTTTLTYNARGQVLTTTDARGKVTNFTYDASGNVTQRRDANSITTFFFYDARSRLTKVRDGLSRSTLYAYDPFGRINKVTHPDNSFVSFIYDLAGRRTRVTDERGNPTNYGYDGAYRLTSVTDAASHSTSYGYDQMSNRTSMTDALSRTTNYDYDDFNRVVKITYPAATTGATRLFETLSYDGDGNVTSRTDTANRTTSYAYDNINRLTGTTDAANKATSFTYDALSRITSLTDAINQQYQFGYDALGRQTSIVRAGTSMSYVYDEVGNRTERTDYNGVMTNYAYDNLNRLTTITYPARSVTYSYDPLNNLTRATNENGSIYIGYDNRYRVSSFSDPFYYGISYNYDTVGNRTALKVNGATYATYTYDTINRLTILKDSANLAFNYNYDAANRLTSRSAPNGVISSYGYDDLNRLTSLMHTAGATTLSGNLYTYNDANNISSWTTATDQRAYAYDAVDRLASVSNFESPVENYTYDAVGNRTASHLSATYGYQGFNKLTSTSSATYSYDNNGNVISKTDSLGTWTFTYDEENRLIQVIVPNGPTVNYKYDGLGRRIQRTTTTGANERYVYDKADVLLDLNADWSVATTYFNGPGVDNHLRQTSNTTGASYFLTDHLGSAAALTDASGNVVEQISYDSFGDSTGSVRTRYSYTGRERDSDTDMLYYRARFYDPMIGRFIAEDPMGLRGGDVNFYGYVKNRSLLFRDPTGLQRCDPILGAIVGGGAGAIVGTIGGGLVGPLAGGAIGGLLLGSAGSFVGPEGTIIGGAGGAAAGAEIGEVAGPVVGAIGGIGIGGYIGYRICSGGEATCDMAPPTVIPFPKPEPRPTPLFPPLPVKPGKICPLKEQVGRICVYECPDGTRFTTMVSDKGQKCPPFAGVSY